MRIALMPRGREWWRAGGIVGGLLALVVLGGWIMISMPGRSHAGPLPPPTAEEAALRGRLETHVRTLAADIGERNVLHPDALAKAAAYGEQALRDAGVAPSDQPYPVGGIVVRNLEAEVRGATRPDEILVVGAHYDSCVGTPGADDNATGVAGVIELARRFAGRPAARTLRFVLFVNEEPPFFQTARMGSLVHARRCRERGETIAGMISLETIGYFDDAKGSQKYPFPFSLFYPDTGNFIGFVGNLSSRSLVRRCIGSFRRHTPLPSEGIAAPGQMPGMGWSDHWSYWQAGYPALMVTDTAPFRNPHYHEGTDTPDRLDFDRLARVVAGIGRVVEELAGE
jgi:hypothetical protein